MKYLVAWSAKNGPMAMLIALAFVFLGLLSYSKLPIDAVPDVTNVQIQVVTRASALSAQEVESQITQPIERGMAGIPGLVQSRSISKLGLSLVTLVFRDDVDVYFARAQANERLNIIRQSIPQDLARPELGPIATGLGEILHFELKSKKARSPEELRTIVEWQVGPRLRQVTGVIDFMGYGGTMKLYRVVLDPGRLAAHGISIDEVRAALERDNAVSGGGYIERDRELVALRGDARFRSLEDIANTTVRVDKNGSPIRVGQLGEVATGPAQRYGAMTRDGKGEIVGGSVLLLKGENSREVTARVKKEIAAMTPYLPEGVSVELYYDRADFINKVLRTVALNLGEGAIITILCLLLTLGSIRAGLLVAGAIPFSMLIGFIGLHAIGYSGNVMSLGAVDFGIIVEGAVLSVEHALSHGAATHDARARRESLIHAMMDVTRPAVFGVVITLLVFLPLASLEDIEGRMFRPVVYSLCFMLSGALVYAFVVLPAIGPWALRYEAPGVDPWLTRKAKALYAPLLDKVLHAPKLTLVLVALTTVLLFAPGGAIGADFLPRVFEGTLAIDAQRSPTIALSQALVLAAETEKSLLESPEVVTVVSRLGRPENSIDPSGPEASDMFIMLKDRSEWRKGMTVEKLVEELSTRTDARTPATVNGFTQPIEMRVNDMILGSRGDLAIKVFGDTLEIMTEVADEIRRELAKVPGAEDVRMDYPLGMPTISVLPDRERASRLGVSPRSILDMVEMTKAGKSIGIIREGERTFELVMQLRGGAELTDEEIGRLPVAAHHGGLVPLRSVADIRDERSVMSIGREQLRRRLLVQCNIRGRDMVGFVKDAQARIAKAVPKRRNVEVTWGGQFENFLRARDRLAILVPISLVVIAVMLFMTFKKMSYVVVTLLNLPFAIAGGVFALWLRGLSFSIPAGVGFIALCGVSVITGIVMSTNLANQTGALDPAAKVRAAAMGSLRARISTALVAAVGFIPAATATGTGAEVQRPLATVVIGGLVASMLLALPALPAMLLFVARREGRAPEASSAHIPG